MERRNRIYGMDCGYFGELYALRLLRNPACRVEGLPELLSDIAYKTLNPLQQAEVRSGVRGAARRLLREAGYPVEAVDRIFSKNQ
ncbi:MAG: hypothetical protein LBQ10_07195 [Desulfovibrio sp.]|jgi:hypothetical protein|nr:hypothetical protein [Desulfovibrio sp.]